MGKRIGMEVAIASAEAAALCRFDVAAVYPITPQSHVAEHLSDIVADGRVDASFITVESEHSALSAAIGSEATGARTVTATSSQGLLYMSEILPIASAMRLPIVMIIANRAVSGPINIWNDHSDIMPMRDTGWISFFADNGQEVVDMTIQAFKIGEDRRVMLPVNVNMDGFQLTHMVEPIIMPDQEEVDRFLPPYVPFATLHPDKFVSMGTLGMPEIFTEAQKSKDVALVNSIKVIKEVWKEWEKQFGRKYEPIQSYRTEDAEVALVTMGSMGETAEIAVDELRKQGVKVGLLKIKLWRPFPFDDLKKAVKGIKVLAVTDRAISFGGPGGPVFSEIRSALYDEPKRPEDRQLHHRPRRPGRPGGEFHGHGPAGGQGETFGTIRNLRSEGIMNTAMKNPKNIIENFDLYAPKLVGKEEFFVGGHRACQGCGEALAIRLMCKALGKDTVITNATGCMEVISSLYPTTAWNLPWIHVAFPELRGGGVGGRGGPEGAPAQGKDRRPAHQVRRHRRRRRDDGHRLPGPLRGDGARPRHALCLLRQRGVHEHGHPALQRHPLPGLDDDGPRRQGDPREPGLEEEPARDHGRPQRALCGHGHPELPDRFHEQGEEGPAA